MDVWLASVTSLNVPRILLALGLLGGAIIVLGLGVWYYRRHWIQLSDRSNSTPWTFEELRAMRDRGDVTEDEYQVLRANILGLAAPSVAKGSKAGAETDASGDTVWSFDLKKSPPP